MGGNTQRDTRQPGAGEIADRAVRPRGHHQSQRPRPERVRQRQCVGIEFALRPRRREIADMRDQRIERGPPLRLIDRRHRQAIRRIRAQPVNCLGGEGGELSRADQRARRRDGGGVGGQNFGRAARHLHP